VDLINPVEYDAVVNKLRTFFRERSFLEVPVQHRLSILAACEDPRTIGTFSYAGAMWPLPQTGQMWLEYELLHNPSAKGFYCISTSYRNEPNPIPGRHDLIFPMFEFETRGQLEDLEQLEIELIAYLGIARPSAVQRLEYARIAEYYNTQILTAEHEIEMQRDFGPAILLKNFPQYTSPFWNMRKVGDKANKIDVLLYGMETIGSAERSTDPDEMRHLFHTISDGMYADILYSQFGKARVEKELEEFLSFDFFPRFGGGIGVTRMIRAMRAA